MSSPLAHTLRLLHISETHLGVEWLSEYLVCERRGFSCLAISFRSLNQVLPLVLTRSISGQWTAPSALFSVSFVGG